MVGPKSFCPERILVPVDFSAPSDAALATAAEMAGQSGAELYLLHVVPMLPNLSCDAYFPEQKYVQAEFEAAERKLADSVERLRACGLKVRYGLEIGNDIVGNILYALSREKADLLVFSTHGMSGWRPAVFGSIAEKVMKLAECPILLLRAAQVELAGKQRVPERVAVAV